MEKSEEKIIAYYKDGDEEVAKNIAKKLNLKLIVDKKEIDKTSIILQFDNNGISLVSDNMVFYGDFSKMINRVKKSNLSRELIVKATKIKSKKENLIAIDATAGLGEDSLLLAAVGFNVELYENNPIIAVLLKDTIERAKQIPELNKIVSRMKVHEKDSIEAMKNLDFNPDIILLDPMFPVRSKSALIKKKFQLLHHLEAPCSMEKELFDSAIYAKPHKIVIKRPLKGEFLANIKPDYSLMGKKIRYDCIIENKTRMLT